MKKLLSMFVVALTLCAFSFAQTTTPIVDAGTIVNLPGNSSVKVFRQLTGVSYMNALNATKVIVPTGTTSAILDITLDKIGTTKLNFKKNTFTITVGYTSCKVNQYVSWTELPARVSVDLTDVDCIGKANVNFLPLLQKGQRIAIFFAKINGSTHDGTITLK